jgi:ERCC4-type nuclease|tara:strand:- start:17849 stop:18610 length:762 start_codon:yes stop_codon:yes gene_type:complete
MKLLIDAREPKKIIQQLGNLNADKKYEIEVKQLEIGDFVIYDEKNDKPLVIIERKSLADLESSIKDGRYKEQSFRLAGNELPNHNIYYLIEGNIATYKNKFFISTLYSSLISMSYFKGFSILNSLNESGTAEIINNFVKKLLKENGNESYYKNNTGITDQNDRTSTIENYINVVKTEKKSNITRENIHMIMLMQVPDVSVKSATAIINKFITIKNLVLALESDADCLNSLVLDGSNRKISKKIIQNIKDYLIN